MSINPYAPPTSDTRTYTDRYENFTVDGKYLIVGDGAELPHRCVFCNEVQGAEGKRISKKLFYVSSLVYILILLNILILLIDNYIFRKPVTIEYSICEKHKKRKTLNSVFAIFCLVSAIAFFVVGGMHDIIALTFAGIPITIAALVFALLAGKGLHASKHKGGRFWLQGSGKEFLKSGKPEIAYFS